MTMSRRLLLLPALLLGGCAVGPTYRRPDPGAPAVTRGQAAPESASLADLGWWDLYHDPALDALVRASLTGGFDARIAAARVQQARALALEARGQLFPGIGYAGNADRGRNTILGNPSPAGTGATGNGFDGYLAASWEFDLWGRVRRLDEAARDQYLATAQAQRGVWLSLVTETATDYFQLLELDEELAVTRDASNAFGESLRLFDQRLRGGIASRLETASAQAEQAAEAAQVPLVERAIAVQENALSVLLGRDPGPIDRGAALSAHAVPPEIPAGLPSALLERRPDVKAAEYAAMPTNAQIGATIGGFLPRIGLSAIFGGVSPRLRTSPRAGRRSGTSAPASPGPSSRPAPCTANISRPRPPGNSPSCSTSRRPWARSPMSRTPWSRARSSGSPGSSRSARSRPIRRRSRSPPSATRPARRGISSCCRPRSSFTRRRSPSPAPGGTS